MNVTDVDNVINRTEDDQAKTPSGHPKTSFGAQQEHNRNITELHENQNLIKIIETWKYLPEAMRKGIMAMLETVVKENEAHHVKLNKILSFEEMMMGVVEGKVKS